MFSVVLKTLCLLILLVFDSIIIWCQEDDLLDSESKTRNTTSKFRLAQSVRLTGTVNAAQSNQWLIHTMFTIDRMIGYEQSIVDFDWLPSESPVRYSSQRLY